MHRMTYHNIRNMIYQLGLSGGYGDKFNYSKHIDEHSVEFEYSTDKDVTDCVYCVMVDNMNGCEIFITVVMYRNDTRTELGVVLKGHNKDDVMTCESYEGYYEGYAVFRTRMHMIHHKATRRLLNRIYNRMMIPEMHKQVADNIREELSNRKGNKDAEL